MRYQFGAFEHHEPVVERVTLVSLGEASGDYAGNSLVLKGCSSLLTTRARSEVESGNNDVAVLIKRVEVRVVIFKCNRRHLLGRHIVAISMFASVDAVGIQIVFVDKKNTTADAGREAFHDLHRCRGP